MHYSDSERSILQFNDARSLLHFVHVNTNKSRHEVYLMIHAININDDESRIRRSIIQSG